MNTIAKWVIAVALICPCSVFGAPIAYNLGFTVSDGEYAETITGVVITDGTIGFISASNILGGTITDSLGTFTFSAGGVTVIGGELNIAATPTQLHFNAYQITGDCLPTNACGFQITSSGDPRRFISLLQAGEPNFLSWNSDNQEYGIRTTLCCIGLAGSAQIYAPVTGKFSGLVYNRSTQTFNSVLTLTNTGPIAVQSPVAIVIATGTTAVTVAGTSDGATYIANLPGGSLAPGASAEVVVAFADPTRVAFTPSITGSVMSDATSAKVIGIAGGTISVTNHLGDQLTLTVPPFALEADTPLSVSALSTPPQNPIAQSLFPGAVLEPEGLTFDSPVTITLSLHDGLNSPNTGLLFWLKDSSLPLPIANQTMTPNSITGQTLHFSTEYDALPTETELASIMAITEEQMGILATDLADNPPSTVEETLAAVQTVNNFASAELTYTADCQILPGCSDALTAPGLKAAAALAFDLAVSITRAALPADACGQYTLAMYQLAVELQQLNEDPTITALLLGRTCSLTVSPGQITVSVGETSQSGFTVSQFDPNGQPFSCGHIYWQSADSTVATVTFSGNPGIPTGVGPGTTDVSGDCDGLVGHAQAKVCETTGNCCVATGTWSGTWTNGNGDSGSLNASMIETNGSISANFNGYNITGTDDNGSVLFGPVTWSGQNGGLHDAYAEGSYSSDCKTISGGWVYNKQDKTKFGSFSLTRQN
jgi:hypothetical protein